MSPREVFSTWLQRNFFAIIVYVLTLGVSVGAVRAEIQDKPDRLEYNALRDEIREVRDEVRAGTQQLTRIERFLCQGRKNDLGCQQ